ncbi:hypothetical protein F1880_000445, partial [Penicillium rolfsii]
RKDFFSKRYKKAKERRRFLRAYKEEDAVRDKDRKLLRTKRLLASKLYNSKRVYSLAERFFGGFKESTGIEISKTDRKEVYSVSPYSSYFFGPLDEFTIAEKVATELFMREAGYGLSLANQRQYRLFWKRLFEMRQAGVDKILLYRTKEFDRFCKSDPSDAGASLVEIVRLCENTYGLQIKQLENRVTRESMGDFTGRLWLGQPNLAERLKIPEAAWNNASNPWFSNEEAITFQSSRPHEPSFAKFGGFLDLHPGAEAMRNKSIFVTILSDENNFFSVCPIISVQEGDFLRVFAGKIRYSGHCNATYGVPGPEGLWLDYSTVTGALNLMGVARPGNDSNVRLDWELINERKEGKSFLMWRVAVRALRAIKPFEEIVRTAPRKEQYLLHQSAACAERGFRKVRGSSTHALPDQQLQTDLEASLQPKV